MAPDKIYSVIILDDSTPGNTRGAWSCVEVEGALNTEYIRKEALLEKIDKILATKPDTGGLAVEIAAQAISDIRKIIMSM